MAYMTKQFTRFAQAPVLAETTPINVVSEKAALAALFATTFTTLGPMRQFVQERQNKRGTAALRGGFDFTARFDKPRRPRQITEERLTIALDDILFADDTSIFTTVEQCQEDENHLQQVLGTWGEDIHPDKTERLPLGMSVADAAQLARIHPDKLQSQARFLGAWITHDASQAADTDKRLQRAKLLWTKLWRQAYRLTLPAKTMGQLFQSTVMATLLYSAECRGFTKKGDQADADLRQSLHTWYAQCQTTSHA